MCQPDVRDKDPDGVLLGVCMWCDKNRTAPIPLPFWSAPKQYYHRLCLKVGVERMAQFLECITAAAQTGLGELARLLGAKKKHMELRATARSRLPDAVDAVLRVPVITADSLAQSIRVTLRAARGYWCN
jgi:hypothetical protein